MKNTEISISGLLKKLSSSISFQHLNSIVNGLIDREFTHGIYEEAPEIIVDLSFSTHQGRLTCDVWDCHSKEVKHVICVNTASYIQGLSDKFGLTKAGLLMPYDSQYGRLITTSLVQTAGEKSDDDNEPNEQQLAQLFGRHLMINIEGAGTDVNYLFCDRSNQTKMFRYMVSAIPGEYRRKLEADDRIFPKEAGSRFAVTRVVDRVLPLSNYILKNCIGGEEKAEMYLCIEQRGEDLLIWNLYRLNENCYVPVAGEKRKVPVVETSAQMVIQLNLIEHELIRNKNFNSPDKVIILTNKEKMMDQDLFTVSDLAHCCREVIGSSEDSDDVKIFECNNAAIDGMLEIEDTIASRREEIFAQSIRKGAGE